MNKSLIALLTIALIGGCQNRQTELPPAAPVATPTDKRKEQPTTPFTQQTLLALLTAEIAGKRGEYDIALKNYSEQARITRDPRVAERAYNIADFLDEQQTSLDNALLWSKLAPESVEAQRAAAIELARAGRYQESMVYMEAVLRGKGESHFDLLALTASQADAQTRAGLLQSFTELQTRYPDNAQLMFGRALLLQQDDQPEAALEVLNKHPVESPELSPLLLRVSLLQQLKRDQEALTLLKEGIRQHPHDKRLRLAYARMLVEQNQLDAALAEFTELLKQYPDDDELRLSLALVCMQAEYWDEAQVYLRDLIEHDSYVDIARYNLGRVQQELGDLDGAMLAWSLVGPGNQYLAAKLGQTTLLLNQGKIKAARDNLAQARDDQPEYAVQLYIIEAESLAEHRQPALAQQTLKQGLKQFPQNPNLLYSRAMLAEQSDNLAQMEADLRLLIKLDPNNTMAINALGYTLVDRTTRYAEARQLLERAHQLKPGDPAIIDSLGWLAYRTGDLAKAEGYLRQAYQLYPDAEIAAHLGEVLWAQGKRDQARQIWAESYSRQPESPILRSTLLRLTGSEKP